jgi:acetyltransferase-like isoleucine patch superfamily enzyme
MGDLSIKKIFKIEKKKFKYISLKVILSVIRGFLLKFKVSNIGSLPTINGKCIIKNDGEFTIGNNFSVRAKPLPVFITVFENAKLKIGDNVFLNYGVDIGCTKQITIGNNVLIGDLTNIIDNNFHPVDPNDKAIGKNIVIQDNVWIGNHCIILPGVCIGHNSVVAAGSVVTHDIPDNVLVAGVPAKLIRELSIPEGWVR